MNEFFDLRSVNDASKSELTAAFNRVLESGWYVLGNEVNRFESEFANYCEVGNCIGVGNCLDALQFILQGFGIGNGDEVIVPAYTFIASSNAILLVNAVPVFVDIDPNTYNMDPDRVAEAVTPKTRAIMPVHFAGLPADMDRLKVIAQRHSLAIIEDAAQAHGARWRDKGVGAQGTMGTFSFQGSKNLNAGEGGIILTNDDGLADIARSLVNCGRADDGLGYSHHRMAGNHRLSELHGALLLSQFDRLEEQAAKRSDNALYLSEKLSKIDGISPTVIPEGVTRHARHLYIFRYGSEAFGGVPKENFVKALIAEGIPASPGYNMPIYRQPVYAQKNFGAFGGPGTDERDYGGLQLPETERACRDEAVWLSQRVLLGSRSDMDDIVKAVAKIRERRRELSREPAI